MRGETFDITIDFDDVIVPTAVEMMEIYNEMFNQQVDVAHFYSGPTLETWGTDDMTIIQNRIEQIIPIIDAKAVVPTDEAIWGIRELVRDGHRPHILTSRDQLRSKVTTGILRTYYSGYIESLTFTNQFVSEDRWAGERIGKGVVSHGLGAKLHIDDHVKHGYDVLDMGTPFAFVFGDTPWNKDCEQRLGLERHPGWYSIVERVRQLAAA